MHAYLHFKDGFSEHNRWTGWKTIHILYLFVYNDPRHQNVPNTAIHTIRHKQQNGWIQRQKCFNA